MEKMKQLFSISLLLVTMMGIASFPRKRIDAGLETIIERREATAHISINRAVTDRQFTLVAGGQGQPAKLVG